ncbi:helix-turn-helix domain-containing protein [Paenibacillus alvei]|uniref:helix-turn-helix domain-containing protein n=1 Tax=Paenibacillus alvei TaxID=44250 RepID=UPI003AF32902
MIKSNLKHFVDKKGISVRQVARDIDYRLESVQNMYNDTMERYPRELLAKLCAYFDCEINELLVIDGN